MTGSRRLRSAAGLVLAVLLFAFEAPASRGQTALDLPERGVPEWNLFAGYGHWVRVNPVEVREQLALVQPEIGWRLSSRLEYVIEGHFVEFWHPRGYALGVLPLGARFFFLRGGLAPYVGIGAGVCWTDLRTIELNRRFNFVLQGGLGLRKTLSDHRAVTVDVRWMHDSNAGTVQPNIGLNAYLVLAGWRFR